MLVASQFLIVVVILSSSPVAKYLVRKYDVKYTGRKIKIDLAYVNPLTGYIYFSNLKIYELKSDSIFFSADDVSASISLLKLFSKTLEIKTLRLNHPHGEIIQNKKDLNINDLIDKFSSGEDTSTARQKLRLNILSIKINEGEFHYSEQLIPINYFIKKVNIESPGKHWDEDTISAQFSFLPGSGTGNMKGDITINLKNKDYRLALLAHKFDLNIIGQYLKDLTNYGSFSANIDADIKSKGNLNDVQAVTTSGLLAINDLHFGKNPGDDYVSFDKLIVAIKKISPKDHIYNYDSISLNHPYIKYERYDYLDNVQTIFGKEGANITAVKADPSRFNLVLEIARYIKVCCKEFFQKRL